jgi:hypothetical protein
LDSPQVRLKVYGPDPQDHYVAIVPFSPANVECPHYLLTSNVRDLVDRSRVVV